MYGVMIYVLVTASLRELSLEDALFRRIAQS
jgi:hypothetical protein